MSKEQWRPQFSSVEYRERLSTKGDEIANHLLEKHNGIPATSCHRCMTLSATFRDLQELLSEALKFESIAGQQDKPK